MQASWNSSSTTTSLERNAQILERFIHSIKSEITQVNSIDYLNAFMRYWHLYEGGEGAEQLLLLLDGNGEGARKKGKQKQKKEEEKKSLFTDMIGCLKKLEREETMIN